MPNWLSDIVSRLATKLADKPVAAEPSPLVDAIREEWREKNHRYPVTPLSELRAGKELIAVDKDLQKAAYIDALSRLDDLETSLRKVSYENGRDIHFDCEACRQIIKTLARKNLAWTTEEIERIADLASNRPRWWTFPYGAALAPIERWWKDLDPEQRPYVQIDRIKSKVERIGQELAGAGYAEPQRMGAKFLAIFSPQREKPVFEEPWQSWSRHLAEFVAPEAKHAEAWERLLRHCKMSDGKSAPSGKWLRDAGAIVDEIGSQSVAAAVAEALKDYRPDPSERDPNIEMLKGLLWISGRLDAQDVAQLLGDFALVCFQKVPNIGARSAKLGNASVVALSKLDGFDGIAQLVRLKAKVRFPSVRATLERSLAAAAADRGLDQNDIEELSVAPHSLSESGQIRHVIGDCEALIQVDRLGKVGVQWLTESGARLSPPKAIKDTHKADIARIKQAVKALENDLDAQSRRIEQLLMTQRTWPCDAWMERYGEHPFVKQIACRLIWTIEKDGISKQGLWTGGHFEAADGSLLTRNGANISLWHPIHSTAQDVLVWRQRIRQLNILQPFKQAFREIYRVTDAELATEVYSNRFAAHILKQHQLSALCQQRNWRYSLQGGFDGYNTPTVDLPGGLSAQFFVEGIDAEISHAGLYLYVATDQVRFAETGNPEPMPQAQVPPVIFSEIMRDVDLFVSVCSIGSNPEWTDGGARNQFMQYWHGYSFGDLSELGRSRRDLLAEIVPMLAIADRCTMDDKYLRIRGNLREYKIHIGSGNILMEPNDQYLCIVHGPARAQKEEKSILTFEGDRTFSVIVSKAFLLAKDDEIRDPTILSQIRAR
ncbi:MAG: DUF4132 domain-containing protein [Parvibaculaceae bacterium]